MYLDTIKEFIHQDKLQFTNLQFYILLLQKRSDYQEKGYSSNICGIFRYTQRKQPSGARVLKSRNQQECHYCPGLSHLQKQVEPTGIVTANQTY